MTVGAIGCLAPGAPWSAPLAWVATKALALTHGDGAAVAIVGNIRDMDARAILIADGFGDFRAAAKASADAVVSVRLDDVSATLVVDGVDLLAVPTGGALRWDPRPALAAAAAAIASAAELTAAADAIAAMLAEGPADEVSVHGDGPFAVAFARLRADEAFPANIVGFGPGSTPAGDDWLAGYLTAGDLAGGGPGTSWPGLRAALAPRLGRTTPAGRALLSGALAGAPPAYLADLALAVTGLSGDGADDGLRLAVRAALGKGASSGRDALAGFLEALRHRPKSSDAL